MGDGKQDIISKIYFDRAGYGSKANTLKDAREKNKSTKMEDVEQFFKKNVEVKKLPRGHYSFVAPHKNHNYQVDVFFYSKNRFESETKIYSWVSMY